MHTPPRPCLRAPEDRPRERHRIPGAAERAPGEYPERSAGQVWTYVRRRRLRPRGPSGTCSAVDRAPDRVRRHCGRSVPLPPPSSVEACLGLGLCAGLRCAPPRRPSLSLRPPRRPDPPGGWGRGRPLPWRRRRRRRRGGRHLPDRRGSSGDRGPRPPAAPPGSDLCSLLATLFLVGPHRQLANMFDETRKVTTIVFLASLFLVLVLCFVNMENILKLTLLVTLVLVQFFASLWYSLSYIPFARKTVVKIGREKFGYADESFV